MTDHLQYPTNWWLIISHIQPTDDWSSPNPANWWLIISKIQSTDHWSSPKSNQPITDHLQNPTNRSLIISKIQPTYHWSYPKSNQPITDHLQNPNNRSLIISKIQPNYHWSYPKSNKQITDHLQNPTNRSLIISKIQPTDDWSSPKSNHWWLIVSKIQPTDHLSSPTLSSTYFAANNALASERFPIMLCQLYVRVYIHKRTCICNSKLFVLILSQINPAQFLPLYLFMIYFNIILHLLLSSQQPAISSYPQNPTCIYRPLHTCKMLENKFKIRL